VYVGDLYAGGIEDLWLGVPDSELSRSQS